METNTQEAHRAKEIAEKRFTERDFVGARHYALKAQSLHPALEGITQMVSTFEIYVASEAKINGEIDHYSILKLNPSADKGKVKKQYRKMAVLLHPDKNKTVGADGAFKLISEAWSLLSDSVKRSSYDLSRKKRFSSSGVVQTNISPSLSHSRVDSFWTVCTSCKVQYEYLRKYMNKRLSCKNCRGVFMAVETGAAPVNGTFSYHPWTYTTSNGHGSHGINGHTYMNIPTSPVVLTGNGVPGHHSGHGSEYVSNVSFQWHSNSGASAGNANQANGTIKKRGEKVKSAAHSVNLMKTATVNAAYNMHTTSSTETNLGSKIIGKPDKKRKFHVYEEAGTKSGPEAKSVSGYANGSRPNHPKLHVSGEVSTIKRYPIPPAFDGRKLLIEKARTEILKKLEEMRLMSEKKAKDLIDVAKSTEATEKIEDTSLSIDQSEPIKNASMSITVPDPDFHDFDKDRSEECFKPKQIWALYDEEDGMPRLYCIIRQVISVAPFKIHLTYLNSRSDSEFGSVNWINYGFTKSCGNFKAMHSDIVEHVNIFSHILNEAKAGRGGCVRVYPKIGEIWAIYKNWTPDWDNATPDEERHQYKMVEVLDDYSEEIGVCVAPLFKLDGYKTVYQKNEDADAIQYIPRREMLRFSHQVPSCLLKGDVSAKLPNGSCWDLDPAATPTQLLHDSAQHESNGDAGAVDEHVSGRGLIV